MIFEARVAGILLAFGVGCSGSPALTATTPPAPVRTSCPSVIGGSVHDLDNKDAAVAGATVTIGGAAGRRRERATLTDDTGKFLFDYAAQPLGDVSVYIDDATGTGSVPACIDRLLWIGVHTHAASGGSPPLIIRMEDRPVDIAAVRRAAEPVEALADKWLTFYEGFGQVVDGSHADCARMGTTLEQFVEQNRSAIAAIKAQRAAMTSHQREQLEDTLEVKFGARTAAVQQKAKGVAACQEEPRVRRALGEIPR